MNEDENNIDNFEEFFSAYDEGNNTKKGEADNLDEFFSSYEANDSQSYPSKEQMISVPAEEEETKVETPDITTQYMMGLLSKTNDKQTHMNNALRVFNKNGYEIIEEIKTEGLGFGTPDTYKYRLRKFKEDGSGELDDTDYWLDEGSFAQSIWSEVGDVGEYVGGGLGGAAAVVARKPSLFLIGKQAGNAFDQFLSHMITGEDLSSTERAKEAGKTAALSIAEITGAKVVGAVTKVATKKSISGISKEAQTIMDELDIDERTARGVLEGVPIEDQAKVLAQQSGGKGFGFMRAAIAEDERARIKYLDELTARKKAVEETAGLPDFPSIKKNTENEYGAMKKYASSVVAEGEGYDLKGYSGRLYELSDLASTSTAKDRIEQIANQLDKYPLNSLEDMIDLRQVINYEASKSTTGKARRQWGELKNNLDEYMSKTFSPKDMKIVDDSIASYSRMKNQEELLEILNRPSVTTAAGKGAKVGEVGAVNWSKLYNDIKSAGIDSPEVRSTLKVSKGFMDKFGDMDSRLFGVSMPKGTAMEADTLSATPHGAAQRLGVRKLFNWVARHVSPNQKAQHAISESIKKSDTQAEFVLNVVKNKNTPNSIKERFKSIATKNHLNRASVNRSKFIYKKAEEATKRLQDSVQKTSIAIDEKDMAIKNIDNVIYKLESKLSKRKTARGKATISEQIKTQDKKRTILQKKKQMLERDHADYKKRYDDSVQQVEELSMFSPKKKVETKAVETYPTKKIEL